MILVLWKVISNSIQVIHSSVAFPVAFIRNLLLIILCNKGSLVHRSRAPYKTSSSGVLHEEKYQMPNDI